MKRNQPSLPSNRAFVVQVYADAQVEQGDFRGRVEHINSMAAEHFKSLEELSTFLARIVLAQSHDESV